jgi:hypothetical protein
LLAGRQRSFSGTKRFFWWTTRQRETSGPALYLEVIGLVEKDTLQVWRVIGFDPTGLLKVR